CFHYVIHRFINHAWHCSVIEGAYEPREEPNAALESEKDESKLLADMADILDGWEPNLFEILMGESPPTFDPAPFIPPGWRIRSPGASVDEQTNRAVQWELGTRKLPHRRARFRVGTESATVNVTVAPSVNLAEPPYIILLFFKWVKGRAPVAAISRRRGELYCRRRGGSRGGNVEAAD
ncbi:hypothetical protein AWZ03_015335, partial [Drosophila navojoa]